MAWTYSDPAANDKDAVRFLVGDTDTTDQLVSDEEISFILTKETSPYKAASAVAEVIAGKFARTINQSADGLSYSGSELFKHYMELAKTLRGLARRLEGGGPRPYAGGIYTADRIKDDNNAALERGYFSSRMHDNPNKSSDDELKSDQ